MTLERIKMDDLIVLGNAVPDEISDYRKTICTACYSPTHGLIRIYPVPPSAPMKRWNLVEIPLEKNPRDTRTESWKIQGSKSEWDRLQTKITVHDQLNRKAWVSLLDQLEEEFGVDCVKDLNTQRKSLGFIRPKQVEYRFDRRKKQETAVQHTLSSDEPFLTIHNYSVQPRVKYRCLECKADNPHDQQILEWGVYESIRKYPNNMEQMWQNLHLGESGYYNGFLVGNQARHRTSFMIISVFRYKINS